MVAFLAPFGGGGLKATYTVHLRLIGKLVVYFLFVLIELFLVATSEYYWKSTFFKGIGHFRPNFHAEGDVPHQPFLHGLIGQ